MSSDPEINAMGAVSEALTNLEPDAQARVLDWARHRFNLAGKAGISGGLDPADGDLAGEAASYATFVDLFDAVSPQTESERALTGGFWFQLGGNEDFSSQQVNDALKDVGHGIGNIADVFRKLERRKPALVRQVAKSGKSQQARKRFKLTSAGLSTVRNLARGATEE